MLLWISESYCAFYLGDITWMSTGQVIYAKFLGASRSAKTDVYTRYRVLGSQKHPPIKCLAHKYSWKKKVLTLVFWRCLDTSLLYRWPVYSALCIEGFFFNYSLYKLWTRAICPHTVRAIFNTLNWLLHCEKEISIKKSINSGHWWNPTRFKSADIKTHKEQK